MTPAMAPPPNPPVAEQLLEVIVFLLGTERFALPLAAVEEVLECPPPRPTPHAPPVLLGVVHHRGALMPVCAPHSILCAGHAPSDGQPLLVLVLRGGGRPLAIAVDEVQDVLAIDPAALRPSPLRHRDAGRLTGVAASAGELIAVVDCAALVAACAVPLSLESV